MAAPWHEQPTTQLPPTYSMAKSRSGWLPILGGLALTLVVVSLLIVGYAVYYYDRVLPGVWVAGAEIGGLREAEAAAALARHLDTFAATPQTLTAGDQVWQIPGRDLGMVYDVPATVQEAMALGRRGAPDERLAAWWPLGRGQYTLQPVGHLDQTALLAGLKPALSALNRPPTDAGTAIKPDTGLVLTNARPGQQIDLVAVTQTLQQRALLLSTEPVPLTLRPLAPRITEQELAPVRDAADALLRQPFALDLQGARTWAIAPPDLTGMLTLAGPDSATLALDEARLAAYLTGIAPDIDRVSRDAELSLNAESTPVITPHEDGVTLDVLASVQAVNQAIARGQYQTTLVTRVEGPAVTTADLEPVRAELERLLDRTLRLSAGDVQKTLARADLASFLMIEPRPDVSVKAAIQPDRAAVSDYLVGYARQVDRAPQSPAYKYLNGQVSRTAEPVQGRTLETEPALTVLVQALVDPAATELALPVKLVDAALAQVNPADIVIRDVLASGTTYYGFSLPERKHNVELATQRLNGTLIPPGELFSFNRSVGPATTATGYQVGYGIILTNGAVQTVPSVGGGICQVATTVFHAAYHAGMPIGDRSWHLYWIPTYGQAPSGMTGLDATVDDQYGLDFTFRNTTGNWLALETSSDGQNIHMVLRGVNPGWEVRTEGPAISNVKGHDPTPVFRDDPTLPKGRRVQVESARDGMDVAITRTVLKDGQVLDQRTFKSHYEPSQNVTLVGTR